MGLLDTNAKRNVFIVHVNIVVYAMAYWLTNPLMPYLLKEHGAGSLSLGAMQSLFNLVQLAGGLVVGYLQDHYSGSAALSVTQLGSALVYVALFSASSLTMLYLSRLPTVLQQSMQVAQAYISKIASNDDRAVALSRLSLSYAVGMVAGSLLSSPVVALVGVRGASVVACALSMLCVAVNMRFLDPLTLVPVPKRKPTGDTTVVPVPDEAEDMLHASPTTEAQALLSGSAGADLSDHLQTSQSPGTVVVKPSPVDEDGASSSTSMPPGVLNSSPLVAGSASQAAMMQLRQRNTALGQQPPPAPAARGLPANLATYVRRGARAGAARGPESDTTSRSMSPPRSDLSRTETSTDVDGDKRQASSVGDVDLGAVGGPGIKSYKHLAKRLSDVLATLALLFITRAAFEPVMAMLFVEHFDVPADRIGRFIAVFAVVGAVANVVGTPAVMRLTGSSEPRSISLVIILAAVSYAAIAACVAATTIVGFVLAAACLTMAGSVLYTLAASYITSRVPKEFHGRAIAMSHATRSAVGIVGPLIGTSVYHFAGGAVAAGANGAVMLAARGLMLWSERRRSATEAEEEGGDDAAAR